MKNITSILMGISISFTLPLYAIDIFTLDFQSNSIGTYDIPTWGADWNNPPWEDGVVEGRVAMVADPLNPTNTAMEVTYPPNDTGGSAAAQWKMPVGNHDHLFLSYKLYVPSGTDFVKGGKLPGLAGGAANSGGSQPNGADGWSARQMWRANGTSGSTAPAGSANLVTYVYHVDQPGIYGEDLRWDDHPDGWSILNPGTWYNITQEIEMNTVGQNDGVARTWLDGKQVLERDDLRFRTIGSLDIDILYFSTFYGGNGSAWEPDKAENFLFDDFLVSTTPENHQIPEPSSALLILLTASGILMRRNR